MEHSEILLMLPVQKPSVMKQFSAIRFKNELRGKFSHRRKMENVHMRKRMANPTPIWSYVRMLNSSKHALSSIT